MKSIILDAFGKENPIAARVVKLLKENGELSYHKLSDMSIQPCRSCGACGFKSPGKCIINDDIHQIMKDIAYGDLLVKLTTVRFGGYSSRLKSAVDRLMPLGLPLYMVKKGHLLHPMRYGQKKLLVIGLLEDNLSGEDANFKALVEKNALNMQTSYHKALTFKTTDDEAYIADHILKVIEEVRQYA